MYCLIDELKSKDKDMAKKIETAAVPPISGFRLFTLHLSCFLLVVLYVNMFQFWAWLYRQLGPGPLTKYIPVVVTMIVVAAVVFHFVQRVNSGYRIKMLFLGLGIVGAFFSLVIPDPHFPIKRIHVAEYIILAFAVRYTLSHRLSGVGLTVFTVLLTMLLGIHDEMLQGIHALRYYGWRDVVVNAAAGASGAMLGHGLLCFEKNGREKAGRGKMGEITAGMVTLYTVLLGAVAALVVLLYRQRGGHISYFSLLPLTGACLFIALLYPKLLLDSWENHGLQAVFWLALGLLVYPLAANLFGIEFM